LQSPAAGFAVFHDQPITITYTPKTPVEEIEFALEGDPEAIEKVIEEYNAR
jgi:hypothetical protein